jgi:ArsR family transcriptional regulator
MLIPDVIELCPEQDALGDERAPLATEDETASSESNLDSGGKTSKDAGSQERGVDSLRFCAEAFRLLGDETRIGVLSMLSDGPKSVSALVAALGLGQPTVSHHLGLLRNSGMVVAQRRGKSVFYDIDREWLEKTMSFLRRMKSGGDA